VIPVDLWFLTRVLFYFAHEATGALGTRHSPRPLFFWGAMYPAKLARTCGEIAKLRLANALFEDLNL
jgi:hypothetical protein